MLFQQELRPFLPPITVSGNCDTIWNIQKQAGEKRAWQIAHMKYVFICRALFGYMKVKDSVQQERKKKNDI